MHAGNWYPDLKESIVALPARGASRIYALDLCVMPPGETARHLNTLRIALQAQHVSPLALSLLVACDGKDNRPTLREIVEILSEDWPDAYASIREAVREIETDRLGESPIEFMPDAELVDRIQPGAEAAS